MKKSIIFTILLTIASVACYGEASLAHFPAMENIEEQLELEAIVDPKVIAKYQEIAGLEKVGLEQLPLSNMGSDSGMIAGRVAAKAYSFHVDTYTISYEIHHGVLYHMAWYIDGCVMTALDGPQMGKQVVFRNGRALAISYDADFYDGYFLHYYPKGIIYSYGNYQTFKPYY
jgi:hypothetical protein